MSDTRDPVANLPGEYEMGQVIRDAVDHDPDKMRMYLTVSVGELAQRVCRECERLIERLRSPVTGDVEILSAQVIQLREELAELGRKRASDQLSLRSVQRQLDEARAGTPYDEARLRIDAPEFRKRFRAALASNTMIPSTDRVLALFDHVLQDAMRGKEGEAPATGQHDRIDRGAAVDVPRQAGSDERAGAQPERVTDLSAGAPCKNPWGPGHSWEETEDGVRVTCHHPTGAPTAEHPAIEHLQVLKRETVYSLDAAETDVRSLLDRVAQVERELDGFQADYELDVRDPAPRAESKEEHGDA